MGGGLSIASAAQNQNNPYIQQHQSLVNNKKKSSFSSNSPLINSEGQPLSSHPSTVPTNISNPKNNYLLEENKSQGILSIQFLATSSSLEQLPQITNPNNKYLQITSTSKPLNSSLTSTPSSIINTTIDIPPRGVILHGSSLNPMGLINNLENNPYFSMLPPPSICLPDFRAHSLFLSYCHGWHLIPLPPTVFSRHSSTCLILGDKDYNYGDYGLRVGDCLRLGSVGLVVTEMRTFSGLEERIDPNILQKLTNEVESSNNSNASYFLHNSILNSNNSNHSPSSLASHPNFFNTSQANLANRLNQEEREDRLHNDRARSNDLNRPNAVSPSSESLHPENYYNIEDDIADLVPGLSQKFNFERSDHKNSSNNLFKDNEKSSDRPTTSTETSINNDEKSDRKDGFIDQNDLKNEEKSQKKNDFDFSQDSISYNNNLNIYCYMCYETSHTYSNPLISPCKCRGDTRYLHLQCLREWYHSSYGGNQSGGGGRDEGNEGISRVIRTSKTGTPACRVCNTPYKSFINMPLKPGNTDKIVEKVSDNEKEKKDKNDNKKLVNIWDEDEKIPYISLLVITKHDANPNLFNSKFRINFRPSLSSSTSSNSSTDTSSLSQEEKESLYASIDSNDTNSYSPILVGRSSSSHLILDYRTVSTHHAQIFYKKGKFYIKDLKSSNGTMLFIQHPIKIPSQVISNNNSSSTSGTSNSSPSSSPGPNSTSATTTTDSSNSLPSLNSILKIKLGRTTITIKEKKWKNDWSNFFSRVVFSPVRRFTNSNNTITNEEKEDSKKENECDSIEENISDDDENSDQNKDEDTEEEKEDEDNSEDRDSRKTLRKLNSKKRKREERMKVREEKKILDSILDPNFDFFSEYQFIHKGRQQHTLPARKLVKITKKTKGEGPTARAVQLLLHNLPYISIESAYLLSRQLLLNKTNTHQSDFVSTQREMRRILDESFDGFLNELNNNTASQSNIISPSSSSSSQANSASGLVHMNTFIEDPPLNRFERIIEEEKDDEQQNIGEEQFNNSSTSALLRNPSNSFRNEDLSRNSNQINTNSDNNSNNIFDSPTRTVIEDDSPSRFNSPLNNYSVASPTSSSANIPSNSSFVIVNNHHTLSSANLLINSNNYYQSLSQSNSNDDLREILRVIPSRMGRTDEDQTIIDDEMNNHNEEEKHDNYFENEGQEEEVDSYYISREETRRDSRNLLLRNEEESKREFIDEEQEKVNEEKKMMNKNYPLETADSDHFFIPLDDYADITSLSLSQFTLNEKIEEEKSEEIKNIYPINLSDAKNNINIIQEKKNDNSFK